MCYELELSDLVREQLVELLVALADTDLHSAGEHPVACFHRLEHVHAHQPGAAGAEVLDADRRQSDPVGHAVEGEGLHDPLAGSYFVEGAVEAVLAVVVAVHVAVGATSARIVRLDPHSDPARTDPLGEQFGLGPGPEDLVWRGVELAADADGREARIRVDLGFALRGGGHDAVPSLSLRSASVASICSSTASRRRNRSSASCR